MKKAVKNIQRLATVDKVDFIVNALFDRPECRDRAFDRALRLSAHHHQRGDRQRSRIRQALAEFILVARHFGATGGRRRGCAKEWLA